MIVEQRDMKSLAAPILLFIMVCVICQMVVAVCASIFQNLAPNFLPVITWQIFRHGGWIGLCPLPWLMWLAVLWHMQGQGRIQKLSARARAIFVWTVSLAAMGIIGLIGTGVIRPLFAFAINNYTALS